MKCQASILWALSGEFIGWWLTPNLPPGHNPQVFIHFFWVDLIWHPLPLFFFFNLLHFFWLSLSSQVPFIFIWLFEVDESKFSDESSGKTPPIPWSGWSLAFVLSSSALVSSNSFVSLATLTWNEPKIHQKYEKLMLLV